MFLGQGTTVAEAVSDGIKTLSIPFRPKSDGKVREESNVHVILPDGVHYARTLKAFESDVPAFPKTTAFYKRAKVENPTDDKVVDFSDLVFR